MKIVANDLVYELYTEFCRLKGYKPSKNAIEMMVDQATGAEEQHMKEFAEWFYTDVITRLEPVTDLAKTSPKATDE